MSDVVPEIDAEAFEREVSAADGPVVLDFYSTECPPCEALAPKYEALAGEYGADVRFLKVFRQGSRALADRLNVRGSPTVLFFDRGREVGTRLTGGVRRADLQRQLDAMVPAERAAAIAAARAHRHTACDVVVVGAGPAGLTAAIYCAQARLRTIVVDRGLGGGNMALTHRVSNYPGFPEPQPGPMLAHRMTEHAKAAGAELRLAVDLTGVDLERREVVIDGVETIHARKVIVATGSSPRPLGIAGEAEHRGRGVSYCATCDAKYYEGLHVVVIGGGNSALQESQLIAKYAAKVTIVHQLDRLTATRELQDAVLADPKFEVLLGHEPRAFVARDGGVGGVEVEHLSTGARRVVACDGAFVFAGMRPNLDGLGDGFALDEHGYVRVDPEMRTSLEGVYAAGDVRSKRFRQMTTAVADGTVAAMAITGDLAM